MRTSRTMKACPGTLAPKRRVTPSSGWMRMTRALGLRPGGRLLGEGQVGDGLELQGHLGDPLGQALARADVDRHPGPAPVVDARA